MSVLAFRVLILEYLCISMWAQEYLPAEDTHFLVSVAGKCSGSLVTPTWVLTAAHCVSDLITEIHPNQNGDFIRRLDQSSNFLRVSLHPDRLFENSSQSVKTVIVHGEFQDEVNSWRGGDLALLELISPLPTRIARPICLPTHGASAPSIGVGHLFMAGFGRRRDTHCQTNSQGPEKFATCAYQRSCPPRANHCPMRFPFQGQMHHECIQGPTPSALESICSQLWRQFPQARFQTSHLFKVENAYLFTCYPGLPPPTSQGWCSTRDPGDSRDVEPSGTRGWGFCSSVASQKWCGKPRRRVVPRDAVAHPVELLDEAYCEDKLAINLAQEQPETSRNEIANLVEDYSVVCVGQNRTRNYSDELYFKKRPSGRFEQLTNLNMALTSALIARGQAALFHVDAGPTCVGDSGGPLFQMRPGESPPIQIGVFSFILWGICRGKDDPAYYVLLDERNLEWIWFYVGRDQMCR